MSSRRLFAVFLLVLAAIGYGAATLVAGTSGLYAVGSDEKLSGLGGVVATGVPALLAVALVLTLRADAPSRLIGALFLAWFAFAVGCALFAYPHWAFGLAATGAIPLLLVLPELRARPAPAQPGSSDSSATNLRTS